MVLNTSYEKKTLEGLERSAEICFKCGVCCTIPGYSCPAQYNGYTPRETFVYDCLSHAEPTGNPALWVCVSCHKCEEMCPYDVSPVQFIEAMKESALEEGKAPEAITGEIRQVLETGFAFPITGRTTRDRAKHGLTPIEPVGDLMHIAEKTGLLALLKEAEQ